jgi:hypothetical protein
MKILPTLAACALAVAGATACLPDPPPPPPPPVVSLAPPHCGQTINDHVLIVLTTDQAACPAAPNQRRIVVDEDCAPLMGGNNYADDCVRGNMAQKPGRALYGPVIARRGSFVAGDSGMTFIASDYWAPAPYTGGTR